MNSSLLVPALVVVAVTAGVFVFGEGLFSGGSSDEASRYAVNKSTKVKDSVVGADVTASTSTGSDFSWDDDTTEQSPVQSPAEPFVSTKQSEEAPGALYGSEPNSPADEDYDSVDDFAATDFGSSEKSASGDEDEFQSALDTRAASKQVDDDLSDFFNSPSKARDSETSTVRSSKPKSETAPAASTVKTVDSSDLDVALASPAASDRSVDTFDNFGTAPSEFTPAPRTKADSEMKSVVMPQAKKPVSKKSGVATSGTQAGGVISGALEPVKDSNSSAMGGSTSGVKSVRKFKITNPKETTLAVTLSVDGKQVTLKPDQSFVVQQSDGDVEVTFSRGGSFGFETKTLKTGHYRFTVSREAGWQLIN